MQNSRLVYTTESGRICPKCKQAVAQCACKKKKTASPAAPFPEDGIVRIRRETQGRKGKTVTAVYGLAAAGGDLAETARSLKRRCGTGGSVKGGVLFIQGDHRTAVQDELQKKGYKVKAAGG